MVAKNGSYSVSLAPGTYNVEGTYALATSGGAWIGQGIDPNTVRVVAGSRQERDFYIQIALSQTLPIRDC